MSSDFIKDLLILSTNDTKIDSLNPMSNFFIHTEKTKFNIPDKMSIYQVLVILPLFSDHEITQGRVSNPEALKSMSSYYPVTKLLVEAIKC